MVKSKHVQRNHQINSKTWVQVLIAPTKGTIVCQKDESWFRMKQQTQCLGHIFEFCAISLITVQLCLSQLNHNNVQLQHPRYKWWRFWSLDLQGIGLPIGKKIRIFSLKVMHFHQKRSLWVEIVYTCSSVNTSWMMWLSRDTVFVCARVEEHMQIIRKNTKKFLDLFWFSSMNNLHCVKMMCFKR